MRRTYSYSRAAVAKAYARSAVGLGATLAPLALLEPATPLRFVLAAVACLFLVYLARSIGMHMSRFAVDDIGIRREGLFAARVAWHDLRAVELNYYTTRNDRSQGWIQLVVKGAGRAVRIESSLDGFAEIATRAAHEAAARRCPLDERTRIHLAVLGIEVSAGEADAMPGARHA